MATTTMKKVRPKPARKDAAIIKEASQEEQNKKCYCRKCQKTMVISNFYEATDIFIDTNGYMSVCKDCVNDTYQKYYDLHKTLEKALYYTCRKFDVIYYGEAVNAMKAHIDTLKANGKPADKPFGYYKSKLSSFARINGLSDFTFQDTLIEDRNEITDEGFEVDDDLKLAWGQYFASDEYAFLERQFAEWKNTCKCDTKAEEVLLREICIKQLEMDRQRKLNQPTSGLLKELQELMKTASVDPAKANAASSGRSLDTYGTWIKEIEQTTPAEWVKDHKLFADLDGLDNYFKKYITRPLKNFITGSRDFGSDIVDGD